MSDKDNKLNFDLNFLQENNKEETDKTSKSGEPIDESQKIKKGSISTKQKIFIGIFIILIFVFFGFQIHSSYKQEQIKKQIVKEKEIAYSALLDKDYSTYNSKLSELSKITNIPTNVLDKELKIKYQTKKYSVISELASIYEKDETHFENVKSKYIEKYFNGNINQFNSAIENKLGYKCLSLIEQKMPQSGIIKNYTGKNRIAPFQIKASDSSNYYIKLVDSITDKTALTMFVKHGETIKRDVPLGSYIVKYATGDKWYGEKYLFGPKTIYTKSDEVLNFRDDGWRVSGYTLTLYKVQNGNLYTKPIDPSEF